MKALIFFCLIFLSYCAAAQQVFVKQWDQRYGGLSEEGFIMMQQTADEGYILTGYSNSNASGNKSQNNWDNTLITDDFWVVKTDNLGNKIWDKRFGGNNSDQSSYVQQTLDAGFIIGGYTVSDSGDDISETPRGGFDYWIVKTNGLGNKVWDKRFGGNNDDFLAAAIQTADGGYLLGGTSFSDSSGDRSENQWSNVEDGFDFWVVKTDSIGNKIWDKNYGSPAGISGLTCITSCRNGGYVLCGSYASDTGGDVSHPPFGNEDYWIIKIDDSGNKIWDGRYGGDQDDDLQSIQQTKDGGYILGGYSQSGISGNKTSPKGPYWIVKIDSGGNKIWDQGYDGGLGGFCNVVPTFDGGYLLSGYSEQELAGGDKSENNLGQPQVWMVKTDSNGNKQWDKTIFTNNGCQYNWGLETSDGCYAVGVQTNAGIGGYKSQPNWDPGDSSEDYWLLKFCMDPTAINEITAQTQITAYPNPFTTDLAINIQQQKNLKQATFSIYNMLGQQIYYRQEDGLSPNYTKMLDLSYLPNGVYVVEVEVGGACLTKEVVKQ